MSTTSSYLLECLASRRELPMGLDPDVTPSWFVEWIGGMAWSQYLDVSSEEQGGGGPAIVAPRAKLNELLNDFWSRHLLKEVPLIVERVQKLEVLGTEGAPSDVVQLYFTQAMKCYAMGLPEAAVALMRACLEHALRDALPRAEGIEKLEGLLKAAGYFRKLSHAEMHMAFKIKDLGNRVMHQSSCSSDEAFEAVTMLRAVVGALYGVVDDPWEVPPSQ